MHQVQRRYLQQRKGAGLLRSLPGRHVSYLLSLFENSNTQSPHLLCIDGFEIEDIVSFHKTCEYFKF